MENPIRWTFGETLMTLADGLDVDLRVQLLRLRKRGFGTGATALFNLSETISALSTRRETFTEASAARMGVYLPLLTFAQRECCFQGDKPDRWVMSRTVIAFQKDS